MLTPQIKGWVVLKVNLGKGDRPREEEMTTDEDGERVQSEDSEPREVPETPKAKTLKGKTKMPKMG